METCFSTTTQYKSLEEYKADIDNTIQKIIFDKERLVFAIAAEKAGISRFVVRQYPELRDYILNRMVYYKELHIIDEKIERAVNSLIKSNKKLTFLSIVQKCNFKSEFIYQNQYLKEKIRVILADYNSNIVTK